jgi:hypothetical protein
MTMRIERPQLTHISAAVTDDNPSWQPLSH